MIRAGLLFSIGLLAGMLTAQSTDNGLILPPERPQSPSLAPCLDCGGSGKRQTGPSGIQTNQSYRYADEDKRLATSKGIQTQVQCLTCKGRGKLKRKVTLVELMELHRQQRSAFDNDQLAHGRLPIGSGYMDRVTLEALPPEAYARLAHQAPKGCRECLGYGKQPCRKCDSTGRTERRIYEKGKSEMVSEPCEHCHGSGSSTCRKCHGDGLLPLCKKCQGVGTMMTRATKKKPATLERCRSCKGEGRR